MSLRRTRGGGSASIRLTRTRVDAGSASGTIVGKIIAPFPGATLSIVSGSFTINASKMLVTSSTTGAVGTTQTVRIRAERSNPYMVVEQDFVITAKFVIDLSPPSITSSATPSVAENTAFSLTLTSNQTVTWAIVGGVDAARFTLTDNTLSMTAKDFEAPSDTGANNVYNVNVEATRVDTGVKATQNIAVTVTNVAAPTNSVIPAVSGIPSDTQTLTATAGTWTLTPDSYLYQWYRAGVAIVGATASTYTVVPADIGNQLRVGVRAVKSGETSAEVFSNSTVAVVAYAAPVISTPSFHSLPEGTAFSIVMASDTPNVTWTKISQADHALFTLTGSTLTMSAKDFENPIDGGPNNEYQVTIRATNPTNLLGTSKTITVTVTDVVEAAPTVTSLATISLAENSALSHTLTADQTVTWTKIGGADTALFTLTGNTLTMTARNYDAPTDADANNSYVVQVAAYGTTTGRTTNQTITVNVTNVFEVANLTALTLPDAGPVPANLLEGAEIASFEALIAGETRTISPNDGRVVFNGDSSKLLRGLTAWTAGEITFTVTRTHPDAANSPRTQTWKLTVAADGSYDYLVHNDTELNTALSLAGTAGGKTIMIASDAVLAPNRKFIDLKPAAELKIVGQSNTRPYVDMSGISLVRCENLTFNYLDTGFDNDRTQHSVSVDGGTSNKIRIQFCEMHGQTLNPPPVGSTPRYPDGYDDYGYSPGGDTGAPGQIPDGITGPGKPTNYGVKYLDNGGQGALTNSVISDNYFHDLNSGFRPRIGVGMVVEGNLFDKIYTDGFSPGVSPAFNPSGLKLRFNHFMRRICLYDDYGNPHGDAIQFSGGNPTTDFVCDGIVIEGNLIWDMPGARGNYQGVLMQDMKNVSTPLDDNDGGRFRYVKIAHNLRVAIDGDAQGINVRSVEGSYVFGNRILSQAPDAFASEVCTIVLYGQLGWMKNYVGYNVAENISNQYGQSENNVVAASTTAGYNAVVTGPTYNPTTAAEALAMFEFKSGGALSALRGKVDYAARTIDRSVERPWIGWDTRLDAALGSPQTSGFRILMGGGLGQSYTANCAHRIADDAIGTGATGWLPAGSGVIDEGKFVELRENASSSGSTTVTANFAVRGYSNLFRIVSASAANFVSADNQDAAYSRVTTQPLTSGTNLGIGVFAMEFMLDTHASNDALWEAGSSTSTLMIPSTHQYRFQKKSSSSRFTSVNTVAHGVWQRMIIFYDLFADGQEAIKAWYINGIPQEFTTSHVAQPTGETNSQAFGSTGMTLLASAAGTAIADAKFRMLFMHETAAGGFAWPAEMLDGGAMHAAFSGDNIGANGAGALGFQPQWFFTPDVGLTAMNSTLLNKGTVSGKDFVKQASTYLSDAVNLTPLTYTPAASIAGDVPVGYVLADLTNIEGATLSLAPGETRATLSGTQLLRGTGVWEDGTVTIQVIKTKAGAPNSPYATPVTLTVLPIEVAATTTVPPTGNTPIDLSLFADKPANNGVTIVIPEDFEIDLIHPTVL